MVLPVLDNRNSNAASATTHRVCIWTGGTNTDYANARNWETTGSGISVPSNGDRVFFPGIDKDVADSFQNSVVLKEFRVNKGFGGRLGTGSLVINSEVFVFASSKTVVDMIPKGQDLHILAMPRSCTFGNGTFIKRLFLHTTNGVLVFSGAAQTRDTHQARGSSVIKMTDAQVGIAEGGATVAPSVRVGAGSRLVAACDLAEANVSGNLEHLKGTITTANINKTGEILSSGPTITTLTLNGGTLTLEDEPSDSTLGTNLGTFSTLTLTNATANGGRISGVDSNRRITNTNPMAVQGQIQVQLVSGQTITLA